MCINFLFKGLGGGLACMAIDCLYSLNGGQLSLTRGKFLLFKYSHFSIFQDFNITLFLFPCKQGDNYSLWSVWEIVSFLICLSLFLIHFTVYFRLFSEISISIEIVHFSWLHIQLGLCSYVSEIKVRKLIYCVCWRGSYNLGSLCPK